MKTKALWAIGILLIAGLAVSRHILTIYFGLNILAAVVALVLHEVSHGIVALYYGDHTAADRGRLSLNPKAHIDPFGTVILPALLLLLHLSPLGYAKPVPIDPSRMRNRRRATLVVAVAGPLTNLVLSLVAGIVLRLYIYSTSYSSTGPLLSGGNSPSALLGYFWIYFGVINAVLFVFNILPIPPLDGSAILRRILGEGRYALVVGNMKFFLPILLILVFIFPALLAHLFSPVINTWLSIFVPTSAII